LLSILTRPKELDRKITGNEDLLLIDTRPFVEYLDGHIQGAINIDLFQFHWLDTSIRGVRDFEYQCRILLSNIGIKTNQEVIFYDNISGMSSARGVWLLLYFSHKKVSLLDGGFARWKKEGYPIDTKTNLFSPTRFVGKPDRSVLATFDEVKTSARKKNSTIVDARTKQEFQGIHVRAARAGHIPSALHIDWEENLEGGSFKTKEKLSKLYSKIPKDSNVVTYCQGGYRAANTFVALRILGYKNIKMYLGSWGEWGNKLELPIES
jgi:thiosulfate/3-mercaptopyruvate sulfurtransferase